MLRAITLTLVVGAAAAGCNRDAAPRQGEPTTLASRELISGEDKLMLPQTIAVAGDYMAIGDNDAMMLKVFDRRSGRSVARVGPRGSGPGEFQIVWSLQGAQVGGSVVFWGFDSQLSRLVGYEVDGSGARSEPRPPVMPQVPGAPSHLQWVNDSTLVVAGLLNQGRLWLVRPSGEPIRPLGVVPLVTPDFPLVAAQQALQPTIAVQPAGDRVAVASRYAGRVDIYDSRTDATIPAEVPAPFEPERKVGSNGAMPIFLQDGRTRYGYIDIAATRDRVFALFSGRSRAGYPGRANYGEQVHVFDWDGHFLGAVDLGRDAYKIAVDSEGSSLYGVTMDPEPVVYEYSLPFSNEPIA